MTPIHSMETEDKAMKTRTRKAVQHEIDAHIKTRDDLQGDIDAIHADQKHTVEERAEKLKVAERKKRDCEEDLATLESELVTLPEDETVVMTDADVAEVSSEELVGHGKKKHG